MFQPIIAFTTCPNDSVAEKIAQLLVSKRLAACVNMISNVSSVYMWEGKIENDSEVKLVIKSVMEKVHEIEAVIKSVHPYEVPEVTAVEMAAISEDYFAWMANTMNLKVDEKTNSESNS